MSKTVLLPLACGFEESEAVTTIDLLRRAGIEVLLAGIGGRKIAGNHELTIDCDFEFENLDMSIDELDGVILAGGRPGVDNLAKSTKLMSIINACNEKSKLVAAICAAPAAILMKTDILEGKEVTGYPSTKDSFWGADYVDQQTVLSGNIITSQGVGTVIDFSLEIISYLIDRKTAQKIAKAIVYPHF